MSIKDGEYEDHVTTGSTNNGQHDQINPMTCFCKYSFMGTHKCHSFMYLVWLLLCDQGRGE